MSLKSKDEKLILIKDSMGVSRVVIDKDATSTLKDRALSIRQTAASTDVITTVGTFTELNQNRMDPNGYKFVEKALFVKDMATQTGTANTLPIYPGAKETITFQPGESAIVYYDDDVQSDGFGRPHWLKFLNDDTLRDLSITKVKDLATLTGRRNNVWYFVENMKGYPGYELNDHALVLKRSDTELVTFRTAEQDYMDGTTVELLHNEAINVLSESPNPPGTSSDAIYVFGDLSDTQQRADFIDAGQVGQWGTATINNVRYLFNIVAEKTTPVKEFEITGIRVVDGQQTKDALEMINGKINKADAPSISSGVMLNGNLTAHYNSQVDNLKTITDLSDLTAGMKKTYTFPNGMTTDTIGGCELTLGYSKDGVPGLIAKGFDLRGWDTSKPIHLPVTYHDSVSPSGVPIYSWIELIMEAVPGDNTKYTLTNYKSGTGSTEINIFVVESIQFMGRV